MVHSRNKGAGGERELAKEVARLFHCAARRGQQFCGGPDSPDIVTSLSGIHLESKRSERFQLYQALEQAIRDAGDKIPVVCHRPNRRPWVAVVRLDDLPRLVKALIPFTEPSESDHENNRSQKDSMQKFPPQPGADR